MRRTALPFGMDRVREDDGPAGRVGPNQPFILPYEGLLRRPVSGRGRGFGLMYPNLVSQ